MSSLRALLLTVGFGILFLLADSLLGDVVITPLLGLCWLMIAATRVAWKTVAWQTAVLCVFVVVSLADEGVAKLLVRTTSFLLGGGLAIAFSHARERQIQALESAQAILRGLPFPLVAADVTGQILVVSDEALQMIPASLHPVLGHSFSDVFMGNLPPGHAMKIYFDWFNREGGHSEALFFVDRPGEPLGAKLLATGKATARLLVVTFKPYSPKTLHESLADF